MEQQIRETYERAFWDMVDQDPPNLEHIRKLIDEVADILCNFVPSRTDIHQMIRDDLSGEVDWHIQGKIMVWVERFQAPIYDQVTQKWKKNLPEKLSEFLKKLYEHLEKMNKQIYDERKKIASGPQLKSGQ